MSAWSTSPRSSASERSPSSLTWSWLSTEVTPNTRRAAFWASRFSRRLPTVPRRVIFPSSVETAIASLSTFGSQKSSSLTSAVRSLSLDICVLLSLVYKDSSIVRCVLVLPNRWCPRTGAELP